MPRLPSEERARPLTKLGWRVELRSWSSERRPPEHAEAFSKPPNIQPRGFMRGGSLLLSLLHIAMRLQGANTSTTLRRLQRKGQHALCFFRHHLHRPPLFFPKRFLRKCTQTALLVSIGLQISMGKSPSTQVLILAAQSKRSSVSADPY